MCFSTQNYLHAPSHARDHRGQLSPDPALLLLALSQLQSACTRRQSSMLAALVAPCDALHANRTPLVVTSLRQARPCARWDHLPSYGDFRAVDQRTRPPPQPTPKAAPDPASIHSWRGPSVCNRLPRPEGLDVSHPYASARCYMYQTRHTPRARANSSSRRLQRLQGPTHLAATRRSQGHRTPPHPGITTSERAIQGRESRVPRLRTLAATPDMSTAARGQ